MRPVSQDRLDQVVEMYLEGHTFVEIGKSLNIGQVPIQRALRQRGIASRPPQKRPVQQVRKEQIVAYYDQGHSIIECVKKFHASSGSVAQYIREAGKEMRFGKLSEDRVREILQVYSLPKMSVARCAKIVGVQRSVVRKYLRLSRISIRPQKRLGKDCWNWKGGRMESKGYYYVKAPKGHPRYPRYVLEHRLQIEKALGRFLTEDEVVHHKDKNPKNNSLENLELFSCNAEHLQNELSGHVPKWTAKGRARTLAGHQRWCAEQRKRNRSKSCARQ